jgi:hypothetical protein
MPTWPGITAPRSSRRAPTSPGTRPKSRSGCRWITRDIYDRKHQQIAERQQEINYLLQDSHEADSQFKIALSGLISLASKAPDLFDRSNNAEKRLLIGFVFSNLTLEGPTLGYSLRKPFDLLVDLAKSQEWRPYRIRTGVAAVRGHLRQIESVHQRPILSRILFIVYPPSSTIIHTRRRDTSGTLRIGGEVWREDLGRRSWRRGGAVKATGVEKTGVCKNRPRAQVGVPSKCDGRDVGGPSRRWPGRQLDQGDRYRR